MKRFPSIAVLLMAIFLSNTGNADPVRIKDARFDAGFSLSDPPLQLRGAGLLKYAVFIDVYAAALYLPPQTASAQALEPDVAKRLEIVYFVDITREQFAAAAMKTLARQLSDTDMQKLRDRINQLHALYRNVSKGDRYALTFQPDQGTTLELNGNVLGAIPGADFAAAYFSIWLGEEPIAPALKDTLLKPDT
ncbi:MAG: chalcone isomerase family protein [Pseudomonadota bacterium]